MRNYKYYLVSLLFVGLFILSACSFRVFENQEDKETTQAMGNTNEDKPKLKIQLMEQKELASLDPADSIQTVSFNALVNSMEGLYRYGVNNQLELGMAERHPTISNNGKTYEFTIKEDAYWSNGNPVTSYDFEFAWKRMVDPENQAFYRYLFDDVILNGSKILQGKMNPDELGIESVDAKTLRVNLEQETAHLDTLLTLPAFLPINEKFYNETGNEFATRSDKTLFNGPFVIEDWSNIENEWTLRKNSNYWDKKNVKLDEAVFKVVKTSETALDYFMQNKLDRAVISKPESKTIDNNTFVKKEPTSATMYLKFNMKETKEFNPLINKKLRKALGIAINNRQFVSSVLNNNAVPSTGLIPTGLSNHPTTGIDFREDSSSYLSHDVREARSLFQLALKELEQEEITLEIVADDTPIAIDSLVFLQRNMMRTLPGLNINIKSVSFKQRMILDETNNYSIQLGGWGADYKDPVTFLELWTSQNPNNTSGYSNTQFDDILQKAKLTIDKNKRWDYLKEAEKTLFDNPPLVPLYQPITTIFEKEFFDNIITIHDGQTISLKYVYRK
ncbi:peptide ABC transporter substrate-binding protein [Lacticigenium naphthae]|uniref:peptide ABC transporter substrate-binding protein n=1 Tax=Lacticigenium naphthae TaxID=515351 RepID=UPI000427B655|nr:peptide ABC transporter substrate-binding protein [Lacticigenium naphthae]